MQSSQLAKTWLSRSMWLSLVFLLGAARTASAQADLIIATNAEIVLPPQVEALTHFYFFTVVDDGGGISAPTITGLNFVAGAPTRIDVYDDGEYTYATFEMVVTVTAPGPGAASNDCFTITYEGESVNPCFDVTQAPRELTPDTEQLAVCVPSSSGSIRTLKKGGTCKADESHYVLELATLPAAGASAEARAAPLGVPEQSRRLQ